MHIHVHPLGWRVIHRITRLFSLAPLKERRD